MMQGRGNMFEEIAASGQWKSITKIKKGWSSDVKYLVRTKAGEKQLLRLAAVKQYEDKQKEYHIIQNIPLSGQKNLDNLKLMEW